MLYLSDVELELVVGGATSITVLTPPDFDSGPTINNVSGLGGIFTALAANNGVYHPAALLVINP
jgi:hypothetical protein